MGVGINRCRLCCQKKETIEVNGKEAKAEAGLDLPLPTKFGRVCLSVATLLSAKKETPNIQRLQCFRRVAKV